MPKKPTLAEIYRSSGAGTIRSNEKGSQKGGPFLCAVDFRKALPKAAEASSNTRTTNPGIVDSVGAELARDSDLKQSSNNKHDRRYSIQSGASKATH